MRRLILVLTLSTITLFASPLVANPTTEAHTTSNEKSNPLALEQCPVEIAKPTNKAKEQNVNMQWTFKLVPELKVQGDLPTQPPPETKNIDPQIVFGNVKPQQEAPDNISDDASKTKKPREVFDTSPAKITAVGTAAMSMALILKLMVGERGCKPAQHTLRSDAPDNSNKPSQSEPSNAHKPAEVVSCVGCGEASAEGVDSTDDDVFDSRYRDTSTNVPSTSSTGFHGRSITGATPTSGNRYSIRRKNSTPQMAAPRTRVNLGRSSVGKR